MESPDRSGPVSSNPVDSSDAWRPSFAYLVIAVGALICGVAYWATLPSAQDFEVVASPEAVQPKPTLQPGRPTMLGAPPVTAEPSSAAAASNPVAPAAPTPPDSRTRDPYGDQTPDLRDYLNPGENPSLGEVITRLQQNGVTTGLAAFNPPGTKPTLLGLAVPQGFEVPEGYIAHHQTTDDGQPLEPILMYDPKNPPLDLNGQPVQLPDNLVVPADKAPAGLPVRVIKLPSALRPD